MLNLALDPGEINPVVIKRMLQRGVSLACNNHRNAENRDMPKNWKIAIIRPLFKRGKKELVAKQL